jgi:hypothetical protein
MVLGTIDVGSGTINVSGTGTGGVAIFLVTAGALNASGLNVGAAPDVLGVGMATGATDSISILGSNGSDFLVGSPRADVISGGPGHDVIANTSVPDVTAGDTLTGGSGDDIFFLSGALGSDSLATLYRVTPTITDFRVDPAAVSSDLLMLSPFGSDYGVPGLQAFTSGPGDIPLQVVGSNGTSPIIAADNAMVKLSRAVPTSGRTLQQAFDAAIGSATITGATADGAYFFLMYDTSDRKMVIGIVDATNGSNTVIEAGDAVGLVGSANMFDSDYGSFTNSQIVFDLPS